MWRFRGYWYSIIDVEVSKARKRLNERKLTGCELVENNASGSEW